VGDPNIGAEPFGFCCDSRAFHGCSEMPSDLERQITEAHDIDHESARRLIARVVACWRAASDHLWNGSAAACGRESVAVADQAADDPALPAGRHGRELMLRMMAAARAENPDAAIVVLRPPAVFGARGRGVLAAARVRDVVHSGGEGSPVAPAAGWRRLYTATSQRGFEALLTGTAVTCFGTPWYAGWGLTDDRATFTRPRPRRSLEQLFLAAYEAYTRYVDPVGGEPCGLEAILSRIEEHFRVARRHNGRSLCVGFRWIRRAGARPFLDRGTEPARFFRTVDEAQRHRRDGDRIVVWGLRQPSAEGVWRMEDGFVRSVGLGTDLVRPVSLVMDRRGIYFDPRRSSDLEYLLASHEFTAEELARGDALGRRLSASRVTKYNVGLRRTLNLAEAAGRRRVLVPGQAEDDWSIEAARPDVSTNAGLLQAARATDPDAYIVYKPHPVVLAGQRPGHVAEDVALRWADRVVADIDIAEVLDAVDAVHTITSLSGFEALIRGKTVHTYGLPFYAGWGLTVDRHACPRRGRRLPLAALVYAALVMYPIYFHWDSGLFVGPEEIIAELERARSGEVSIVPRSLAQRLQRGSLLLARRADRLVRRTYRRLV